jgi:hypothetical protein
MKLRQPIQAKSVTTHSGMISKIMRRSMHLASSDQIEEVYLVKKIR